jgi:hypothetical protein
LCGRSLEHFEQALSCSLEESDEQREGKKKFPRLAEKEMSSLPKPEEGGATASLLSPEQLGRLRARVYFELSQVAITSCFLVSFVINFHNITRTILMNIRVYVLVF